MSPKPITKTVAGRIDGHAGVGRDIFGQRVYASDVVPQVVPPSWTADRQARAISGFGDAPANPWDAAGFEKGPSLTVNGVVGNCGIYGRMTTWDRAWPCTEQNSYNATVAYLNYKGLEPSRPRFIAEEKSMVPTKGIPPFGKSQWMTDMCKLEMDASGNYVAPVPKGLTRPSVCEDPTQWPESFEEPSKTPKPAVDYTPQVVRPGAGFLQIKKMDSPAAAVTTTYAMTQPASSSKTGLFVALGVAALAIGGGAYYVAKKKRKAA
jgi:hypothetical protein